MLLPNQGQGEWRKNWSYHTLQKASQGRIRVFSEVTEKPAFHTELIIWKSDELVWVNQRPLTEEKLQAGQWLVQEQLYNGHITPSNSPWNSIFVIKKKSGKWRSIQDLREVNGTTQRMGALQPGLSSPIAILKDTYKTILDLKDCFYTIPLAPQDCQRFAFSIPLVNFKEPMRRYQWSILPQGMANSEVLLHARNLWLGLYKMLETSFQKLMWMISCLPIKMKEFYLRHMANSFNRVLPMQG